jgi:hypothetical protein
MADTGRSFELSYQCSSEPVQYRRRRRQSTASSSHPHNVALRPKAVHSKPLPARSDLHRASFFRSPMTTFLCTPAIFLAIELIDISLLPSLFYALAMLAWICVAATWTRMIWSWANFSRFLCIASLLLGRAYLHVSPRDVRIIGFYPAIMIHWLRLTFAVVGLEWIARRGFKWLDGFVAEKWPGVPLDPVKATASRAWRISTQPEVLKAVSIGGCFMVGSTLAYCIVNWQTYIYLAQLQPGHPALSKCIHKLLRLVQPPSYTADSTQQHPTDKAATHGTYSHETLPIQYHPSPLRISRSAFPHRFFPPSVPQPPYSIAVSSS